MWVCACKNKKIDVASRGERKKKKIKVNYLRERENAGLGAL